MRPCNILSGLAEVPGTMFPGQNAACSISLKKFSGFLFKVILPISINGKSSSYHVFVVSNGSKRYFFAYSGVIICTFTRQEG